jgi:hypothetical protein
MKQLCYLGLAVGFVVLHTATPKASVQPDPPGDIQTQPQPVRRIGPTILQLGNVRVDTEKRELSVAGRINQVTTLEFIANTPNGAKAYESAITIESDATTFNAALLLLGLDPARARRPRIHLDPLPPAGDQVEIQLEVMRPGGPERINAQQLLWNQATGTEFPLGPWVYTGSAFFNGKFLAEQDGVLIGFVHSPAALIDNQRPIAGIVYGDIVINPNLGLTPNAPVTLLVRSVRPPQTPGGLR